MTSEGRSALTVAAIAAVVVALGVAGALLTLGGSAAQRPVALDPDRVPPAGGPVVTSLGIEASPRPAPGPLSAAVARARLEVRGARQDDLDLGDPRAPITITEYVDLRCAECATVHRDVLPKLIRREVRTGRVHAATAPTSAARRAFGVAGSSGLRGCSPESLLGVRAAGLSPRGQPEERAHGGAAPAGGRPRSRRAPLASATRAGASGRPSWKRRSASPRPLTCPLLPVFLVKAGDGPLTVLVQPTSLADFERAIAISSGPPLASFGASSDG